MKKINKIILSVIVALFLAGVIFVKQDSIIETFLSLSIQLLKPEEDFTQENMVSAPDYSKTEY